MCKHPVCTLHHIISSCSHALNGGRYTWRHDSVLSYLKPVLLELVAHANEGKQDKEVTPPIKNNFVAAGKKGAKPQQVRANTMLAGTNDWRILVDLAEKLVYPPEIYGTSQRPDAVIWSSKLKTVINIELTCPAEEGIEAAQVRKEVRYFELKCAAKDRGWKATNLTLEAGARGYVARTIPRVLKLLGRAPKQIKTDVSKISNISARCSFAIYLARESFEWDENRELLTAEDASRAATEAATTPTALENTSEAVSPMGRELEQLAEDVLGAEAPPVGGLGV